MKDTKPILEKHIALIGCGTIGSHLAKLLVQSGAGHAGGKLYLIDNQTLEPGNIGRHYLGFPSIGMNKATALKQELSHLYPDADISDANADAVDRLKSMRLYDLVIDATGEEALSNSINDYFVRLRAQQKAPALLHIRLFGNGVAAQGLLVSDIMHACFRCLKQNHDGKWRFSPLKKGTEAILEPAACGEDQFIAYGVAAPVTAAALALQMTLDWNNGTETPRLRTARIRKSSTVDVPSKNPTPLKKCPACAELPA